MKDFFSDWAKRGVGNPAKLARHTVSHDKWDEADYRRLLKEMQELAVSEDRITDKIDTGGSLFGDSFFSLIKVDPHLMPPGTVRPSYLVNRAVMDEAMDLNEWEELRGYSVGDEIGAALACVAMEPELETLYDRLKTEQDAAKALAQQEQDIDGQQKSIDDLMQELENFDPNNPDHQQQAANYQQQLDAMNAQLDQMMQDLANGAADLQQQLDKRGQSIKQAMKNAINKGIDEVAGTEAQAQSWGLDRGHLMSLPAAERLELAKRLNNPRLKRIAELIGPMSRLAFAEQMRKTTHANDEVYDLSMGNDLSRVLSNEFMALHHPLLKLDFYRKYMDGRLLQYELRGEERVAKGGIICCEDGSGSMHGDREMWSKAVSLCLLHIARAQRRGFYGIHFGGPYELSLHDFRDPQNIDFEGVMKWAETFFGGGTDFMTPLAQSLNILQEEYDLKGAISGDIVFITDGQCGLNEDFIKQFKEKQAKLGFRVFGIIIGGTTHDEPLRTICDGRVFTVKDLTTGDSMRDVFRMV